MERVAADLEDELTLYDLEEYVEYMVRVRAYNEDGPGPFSPAVTVMTYQDGIIYSICTNKNELHTPVWTSYRCRRKCCD